MPGKNHFNSALLLSATAFMFSPGVWAAEQNSPPSQSPVPVSPFPLQLEASVPFEPTAFASDGRQHLVYELVLRNYERQLVDVQELVVFDADHPGKEPIAVFAAADLQTLMKPVGAQPAEAGPATTLASGASSIVYLLLTFDSGKPVPARLQHHIRTSGGELTTGRISTQHDVVQVLGPPVTGSGWLAETGLSNDNGHRRGYLMLHGRSNISRRYAFDWVQVDASGAMYEGDEKDNAAYFGYGEPVVAVSDAEVVAATNDIPANVPGRKPAIPITLANTAGNGVTLDLGHGHYAHYMHLQPGSVRVKAGDRVERGQVLGLMGNSGDSFAPHLHFEITTSAVTLGGEGVPYVFDTFQVADDEHGTTVPHTEELPVEKMLVDFGN